MAKDLCTEVKFTEFLLSVPIAAPDISAPTTVRLFSSVTDLTRRNYLLQTQVCDVRHLQAEHKPQLRGSKLHGSYARANAPLFACGEPRDLPDPIAVISRALGWVGPACPQRNQHAAPAAPRLSRRETSTCSLPCSSVRSASVSVALVGLLALCTVLMEGGMPLSLKSVHAERSYHFLSSASGQQDSA
ncbi:hypothetical protein AAFF_G00275500 [Aldrovandia affinis]|uniref:Uncharacterized protein n=1 Tax=Aldrovandia affinis TaxID=143900 RepID=A0AAD7SS83_9TELE|nr:hypothetical protein AAFF_G00275500 [Aldrovandia affinis]